jgi:hypothetical protein
MKLILLLAIAALALSGCASRPLPKTLQVEYGPTDEDEFHPWVFMVEIRRVATDEDIALTQKLRTLEDYKAFIATLPSGTVLHWDSGCIGYVWMPMSDEKVTVEDFKQFAKRHGVTFEHVVSGF